MWCPPGNWFIIKTPFTPSHQRERERKRKKKEKRKKKDTETWVVVSWRWRSEWDHGWVALARRGSWGRYGENSVRHISNLAVSSYGGGGGKLGWWRWEGGIVADLVESFDKLCGVVSLVQFGSPSNRLGFCIRFKISRLDFSTLCSLQLFFYVEIRVRDRRLHWRKQFHNIPQILSLFDLIWVFLKKNFEYF